MTQLLEEAMKRVEQLSSEEQDSMAALILAELEHTEWDKEIEQDLKDGSFDTLKSKIREDIAAGKSQPL